MPLARLFGLRGALRVYGRPRRGLAGVRDVPVLLLVGRDDPVGGSASVHRLARAYRERAGLTDVTTHVYDGRHEILREPVAAEVVADLLAWLDRRLPRG